MANQCFQASESPSTIKPNCQCESCDEAPIVNCTQADISNAVCTPILAKVIQNCIYLNTVETEYPSNLVFRTNLDRVPQFQIPAPSGRICIDAIEFGYDCIGIKSDTTPPTTQVYIDGTPVDFFVNKACSCGGVDLFNSAYGQIKTKICCCPETNPPTQLTDSVVKIVQKQLNFGICNLNITLRGKICHTCFTATLFGTYDSTTKKITKLPKFVPLTLLDFNKMNFAGKMCLPTNTKFDINEDFSSLLSIDCVKLNDTEYDPTKDPFVLDTEFSSFPHVGFVATTDISVAITDNIYAILKKKLAVLSTAAPINCVDGSVSPDITPLNPCNRPCHNCHHS
jgi:hypothetical protein